MTLKHAFLLILSVFTLNIFSQTTCDNIEPPVVSNLEFCFYEIVGQILQADEVSVGGIVKWYASDQLDSYIRDERIILDYNSSGTYYARTEIDGCISETYSIAEVNVIHQPAQLFVESVNSCSYEYANTSEFIFNPAGFNSVSVYADNDVSFSTPLAITGNRFTAPQITGSNSYVAIQYTPETPEGTVCASDPFVFTYQLYPEVDVPSTVTVAPECYMDTDPVYERMAVITDNSTGCIWYNQFEDSIGRGRRMSFPVADVTTHGTYTYYVKAYDEHTFQGEEKLCYDQPRTYTRTFLETPPAPVIADDPFCYEEFRSTAPSSRKVRATSSSNYEIIWMAEGGEIVDNNPDPLYILDNDGDQTFDHDTITLYPGQNKEILAYAVLENCYSEPTEVQLSVRPIPRFVRPISESFCYGQDTLEPLLAMSYDINSVFSWYQGQTMTEEEITELQYSGMDYIIDNDIVFVEMMFEEGSVFFPDNIDHPDTYWYKVFLRDSYGCLSDTATTTITANDCSSGISIPLAIDNNISISPTPAHNRLNIEISSANSTETTIEIIDILGKTMLSTQAPTNQTVEINVSELSAGIYTLRVKVGNKISTQQLIIE